MTMDNLIEKFYKAIAEKLKSKKMPFFPIYIIMGIAILLIINKSYWYIGVHLVMLGLLYGFVMYGYNDYLEGLKNWAKNHAILGMYVIGFWILFIAMGILPI